jgi:DNA polymerase-3 subunit delta
MQAARILPQQKPVYLLASSEPLLLRDWLDDARRWLREQGYEDIVNQQAETGFDWNELLEDSGMMSLFAARKCRIVHLPTGKPGQQGSKVIQALCESPAEDSLHIFVVPALDRQSKNSSWYKAIQHHGAVAELKPVYENQLVDWISQRARSKQLDIDMQSAQFLAECTEGNLLAADQELEKLLIRFGAPARIDFETIEASVAQSARYSHFLLVDACLAGKLPRALKILKSLAAEGYATAQLRWAVQGTLEQLDQLKRAQRRGGLSERDWQQQRIWRNRQRLFQAALARLGVTEIERLLQSCAKLDRLGKGQQDSEFPDQDWVELRSLVARFCG